MKRTEAVLAWRARLSTPRVFAILLIAEVALLACENMLDFPLSVPFMRRATGQPYLDMCAFCSAAQVHGRLVDFGPLGRHLQLLLMATVDVAIPVLSFVFASVGLTVLLRGRGGRWRGFVRVLPLVAMILDFSENALIVTLVTAFPARLDRLETLTGIVTGLKFCAYLAVAVALSSSAIARSRPANEVAIPSRSGG
jgi:hypothetical protein